MKQMVKVIVGGIMLLAGGFFAPAQAQLSCAELDGAYVSAQTQARDNLGFLGTSTAQGSIYFGQFYGLFPLRTEQVFKSPDSPFSHANAAAAYPPVLVKRGAIVAYLSTNAAFHPRVSLTQLDQICRSQFTATSPAANLGELPPAVPRVAPNIIGAGLSGLWWNSQRGGEGVNLDVGYLGGNEPFLLFTWYAYDSDGFPIFLFGAAPYTSADTALTFDLSWTVGSPLRQNYDPSLVRANPAGRVTLQVRSCNAIDLSFTSSSSLFGNATIVLSRFASALPAQACP